MAVAEADGKLDIVLPTGVPKMITALKKPSFQQDAYALNYSL